jgi:hypothetical protein
MNIEQVEGGSIPAKRPRSRKVASVTMELGNSRIAAEMTGIPPRQPKPTMRLVMTLGKN